MTKFYVDISGKYLGGFEGVQPPEFSIEVPIAPKDARYEWDGSQWVEPIALKDDFTDEKRDAQVSREGVTLSVKVNALWLKEKGDSTEFDRIEAIIVKAAQDFPK